jgi:hypothetical protein
MLNFVDSLIDVAFERRQARTPATLIIFGCRSAVLQSKISPAGFSRR